MMNSLRLNLKVGCSWSLSCWLTNFSLAGYFEASVQCTSTKAMERQNVQQVLGNNSEKTVRTHIHIYLHPLHVRTYFSEEISIVSWTRKMEHVNIPSSYK